MSQNQEAGERRILRFDIPPSRRRFLRDDPGIERGRILLFTGVRYERDVAAVEPARQGSTDPEHRLEA